METCICTEDLIGISSKKNRKERIASAFTHFFSTFTIEGAESLSKMK